jgi:ABC-2 type transport system permease protein
MTVRSIDLGARSVPPLGGFNLTFLYLEVRRLLRNRRTLLLSVVAPLAIFFLFESRKQLPRLLAPDYAASTMIGVAVYGAMMAATSGGAMVSVERALGWSRQLRLTPLQPAAYIAIKLVVAMLLGLLSVAVVFAAGGFEGVHLPGWAWFWCALLAWITALVFASFGLFMGYLLPSENVMQILGPVLGVFAFFGGLFVPLSVLPSTIQDIGPYMPTYGVVGIARYPLLGGAFDVTWLLNLVLWTAAFAIGAMVLFRRDTRRV